MRQRLREGARHLISALSLQETDNGAGLPGNDGQVTSAQMWDLLRSCVVRMRRMDLAAFCERRDLEGTLLVVGFFCNALTHSHLTSGFRALFASSDFDGSATP
jgi:hypothetical protein